MRPILGAGMILTGFLGMGLYLCEREEIKLRILTEWKLSLQILCNEISSRHQPMIFALWECGKRIRGEVGEFYKNTSIRAEENRGELPKIWREELRHYFKRTTLSGEEKRMMEPLEDMLGYEDEQVQLEMLKHQIDSIDNCRKEIAEKKREKKKIILLLSTCSGMVVILLLI